MQKGDGEGKAGNPVQSPNLFNTGVYAMRSTNTSIKLVRNWLRANDWQSHDQAVLNKMAFKAYVVCSGPAVCQSARAAGWATVFRHPSQFGEHGVCPGRLPNMFSNPCGEFS